MAADRVPVRQVLAHKKRRKENFTVIAASGLYKAKEDIMTSKVRAASSVIRDSNYMVIQGWMLTRLGLKGNELLIYAVIYGFTQNGETEFVGSMKYLADWTNSTIESVRKCIKSLIDKGYIIKSLDGSRG